MAKAKQRGVSKPSRKPTAPVVAAAVWAVLSTVGVARGEPLEDLVGLNVDVPNAYWGNEHDDGAFYCGTIHKVSLFVPDGQREASYNCHVRFAKQAGWGGRSEWLSLNMVTGQTKVGKQRQVCRLWKATPAPKRKEKAAATAARGGKGSGGAAATDDTEEDDFEEELEWLEGFEQGTPIPQRADPLGGLKQRLSDEPAALEFHKLTCPDEVYELVLKQTLRQAKERGFDWSKTDTRGKAGPNGEPTLSEMKVFFAVTMYMSIVKQTVLREYWDEGFYGSDLVKRHFTVHRFEAILSNLHFADPKDRPKPMVSVALTPASSLLHYALYHSRT